MAENPMGYMTDEDDSLGNHLDADGMALDDDREGRGDDVGDGPEGRPSGGGQPESAPKSVVPQRGPPQR